MLLPQTTHHYPRPLRVIFDLVSAALAALSALSFSLMLLRGGWDLIGRDDTLVRRWPWLLTVVDWVEGGQAPAADLASWLPGALTTSLWAAAGLLAALLLANALPSVRISTRGLLVEFAGGWLPVAWEDLRTIRTTADLAGERFVLLVLPDRARRRLTGWHRLYGLIYGFLPQPAFYITSAISSFDQLLNTILQENARAVRAIEGARPLFVDEQRSSPLFSLLLSPGAFFSRRAAADAPAGQPGPPPPVVGGPVLAVYPARIRALLTGAAALTAAFALWHYLSYWTRALALMFPQLRPGPLFGWLYGDPTYRQLFDAYRTRGAPFLGVEGRLDLPAPFWLLVAGHLMLLIVGLALLWSRYLLPSIEARSEGLSVTGPFGRRHLLPWARVAALKVTELSEQSQILLLQARGLPLICRLTSLLYDGSAAPGVLITSAIGNFQPLIATCAAQLEPLQRADGPPILQPDARSPLLWLGLQSREAIEQVVTQARADEATRQVGAATLLPAARTMAAVALPPALIYLLVGLVDGDQLPGLGLLLGALGFWIAGMLEWPLVALISVLLDENTGGGEEGYRALAVYPSTQLPRLLAMALALILIISGAPLLWVVAWVAAMVWAYWLTAALWVHLYDWGGSQVILGGLLPVAWQLLLLIGFQLAR